MQYAEIFFSAVKNEISKIRKCGIPLQTPVFYIELGFTGVYIATLNPIQVNIFRGQFFFDKVGLSQKNMLVLIQFCGEVSLSNICDQEE